MQLLTTLASASAVALAASAVGSAAHQATPAPTPVKSQTNTEMVAHFPTSKDDHVTVHLGDSLAKIARRHDSTWRRLYDANTVVNDPNMIFPGQKLVVPAKGEAVPHRPLPVKQKPVVKHASVELRAQPVAYFSQPAPAPAPAPAPKPQPQVAAPAVASGSAWDRLAACESSGNWAANTGNGFYGGLQFTLSSWRAVGGTGLPSNASRAEQIMRAQKLQAIQGWGAWPVCSIKAGLR